MGNMNTNKVIFFFAFLTWKFVPEQLRSSKFKMVANLSPFFYVNYFVFLFVLKNSEIETFFIFFILNPFFYFIFYFKSIYGRKVTGAPYLHHPETKHSLEA